MPPTTTLLTLLTSQVLDMNADAFIDKTTDPEQWIDTGRDLRKSAEVLWDEASASFEEIEDAPTPDAAVDSRIGDVASYISAATLLLGLATENALKGHLIANRPEDMEIELILDGNRKGEAELTKIAGQKPHHDLERLAEAAGVFGRTDSILGGEFGRDDLRSVLNHLTHGVKAGARYPVWLKLQEREGWENTIDELASTTSEV